MLILVAGLPGTGKTTFARALAKAIGAAHLNTDILRSTLGLRGNYHPETKERVYREVLAAATAVLARGGNLVVDATFHRQSRRQAFAALADRQQHPQVWILVHAPRAVVRERLGHTRPDSEADWEVYRKIEDGFEPLSVPHLKLDSGQLTVPQMVEAARQYCTRQPTADDPG